VRIRLVVIATAALAMAAACSGSPPLRAGTSDPTPSSWPLPTTVAAGAARPTAATTGVPAGVTLHHAGSVVADHVGQVIDGLDVDGSIEVKADNVTIKNTRLHGGAPFGIRIDDTARGTVIEDSEIAPDVPNSDMDGIWADGAGFIGRRLHIHSVTDGIKASGDFLLEGSFISDLTHGPEDHSDAIQIRGGAHFLVLGNSLSGTNACVMADSSLAALDDLTVDGNWLDDGAWTLNLRGGDHGDPTGVVVSDNTFGGNAQFGHAVIDGDYKATGNVDSSGAPADI
jgi:hypothetical protein